MLAGCSGSERVEGKFYQWRPNVYSSMVEELPWPLAILQRSRSSSGVDNIGWASWGVLKGDAEALLRLNPGFFCLSLSFADKLGLPGCEYKLGEYSGRVNVSCVQVGTLGIRSIFG